MPQSKKGHKMAIPYENQLIGAFIFCLGHKAAELGVDKTILNLFQQTPQDPTLGDLIVGATRVVAIEFKRNRDIGSEQQKWDLGAAVEFFRSDAMERCKNAHLFAYSSSQAVDDARPIALELLVERYQSAIFGISYQDVLPETSLLDDLLLKDGSSCAYYGAQAHELESYLMALSAFRRTEGGGGEGGGWLVIGVDGDSLKVVHAKTLEELMRYAPPQGSTPKFGGKI